jgi:hypothetical protein
MTTRIEKDTFFQVGIHFKGNFYVNTYEATLSMLVETTSAREQAIAMARIGHFISVVLQHCLMIQGTETEAIQKYKDAGMRVCELPEEPLDQVIAMVLLQKLNAIIEERMIITDMTLGSVLSEGVRYNIVSEVAESILNGDYWWNKPCLSISNEEITENQDNILKLFDDNEWAELGLTWKERSSQSS